MPTAIEHTFESDQPVTYQIRVKGHLDQQWMDRLGGATFTLEEDGSTLFVCPVIDQAALYGLLRQIRDLGMPLLLVSRVEPQPATTHTKE